MPNSSGFHTTRWTQVRQSGGDDTVSQQALSDLCGAYYSPVVIFIARSGFEESRARDLAHDFFMRLLASPKTLKPDPARGRFRSYLLGAVKHFVADALDHERAQKRGGAAEIMPLTDPVLPVDGGLGPDRAFDRQWALTVIERGLQQLAHEFESAGKTAQFVLLKPWLTGDEGELTQAEIALQLGMNEGAVKVAVHRLRHRFRELIKTEVSYTVDKEHVRGELTHLLSAM